MIHLILTLEQAITSIHKFALLFPLTLDPVIRVAGQSGTGKVEALEAWKPGSPPLPSVVRAGLGAAATGLNDDADAAIFLDKVVGSKYFSKVQTVDIQQCSGYSFITAI